MFCSPQLRVLLYFFLTGVTKMRDSRNRMIYNSVPLRVPHWAFIGWDASAGHTMKSSAPYSMLICEKWNSKWTELTTVPYILMWIQHENGGLWPVLKKLRSPDRLQDAQYLQTHPIVPLFSHSAQWMKRTSSGSTNPVCFEWERSLQSIISWSPRCATCALYSASAHEWMISGTNMNLFVVLFLSQAEMESDRIIDMTRWVHQYLGEVALLSETAARRVIVVYKIYAYDISQRWDTSRRRT